MKKFKFLIVLALLLVLASCGSNNKTDANLSINNKQKNNNFKIPDFGQPKENPDIHGLVKSISGNEAIILKIDRPQNREVNDIQNQKGTSTKQQNGNNLNPGFLSGSAGGGRMMMGGGSGPKGERNNNDPQAKQEMLEKIKQMSGGEEIVIIPVGIKMLKSNPTQAGQKNSEMVEAILTDVQQDKMITVWLDKSVPDRKVASFVLIM